MFFESFLRRICKYPERLLIAALVASPFLSISSTYAQEPEFNPGEAFSTRFSGVKTVKDGTDKSRTVIDMDGVVGSVIDIRNPGEQPRGQHWLNEPQRLQITAGEVGQVFGIAIDDAKRPNIYISATSAFGLHRDGDRWMPGMWGKDGGPGTIYKLSAENGYKPEVFAKIKLEGRSNTGAALGNIAYDRVNRQLFVSDLETGMVHRLDIKTGRELGVFDHGVDGRSQFLDVKTGAKRNLKPVEFDLDSSAQVKECEEEFEKTASCWNFADFRRRVWGLGVHVSDKDGAVRLYYALWSSQAFGNPEWKSAREEQVNTIWSVGLKEDGSFDKGDIRREFALPGFFSRVKDFLRAGASHPVSDIAFSEKGEMLVAERGGVRNLGLDSDDSFATPSEARVLRYRQRDNGQWEAAGRYAVGFYDRKDDGKPFLRAGSSGGVDFGYGYQDNWTVDLSRKDQFAWMSGDRLCSAAGPCLNPETDEEDDVSEVHGLQGLASDLVSEVAPPKAFKAYPDKGEAVEMKGVDQSYLIDTDLNVDEDGEPVEGEQQRNDATRIGDVEIYKVRKVVADTGSTGAVPVHLPVGSRPSHAYPYSIHEPEGSEPKHEFPFSVHRPIGSEPVHEFPFSVHLPIGSVPLHEFPYSIHYPRGSKPNHRPWRSLHWPRNSRPGHEFPWSIHRPIGSKPSHKFPKSVHLPRGSKPQHKFPKSVHLPIGSRPSHKFPRSIHLPRGSKPQHQFPKSVHLPRGSKPSHKFPKSVHLPVGSKPQHKFPKSVHLPHGSKPQHKFPKSVHLPHGSKPQHQFPKSVHLPHGSKPQHKFPKSVHLPHGSKPQHKFPKSVHLPHGSKPQHKFPKSVHLPVGSKPQHKFPKSVHLPRGSRPAHKYPKSLHLPRGSNHSVIRSRHKPVGSVHRPRGSKVHRPRGSRLHKAGVSRIHRPRGSRIHRPRGSKVHRPRGSRVHKSVISRVHKQRGSRVHRPRGSKIHRPRGSRVHRPRGSRVHRPLGSRVHSHRRSQVKANPGRPIRLHRGSVSRGQNNNRIRIQRPRIRTQQPNFRSNRKN